MVDGPAAEPPKAAPEIECPRTVQIGQQASQVGPLGSAVEPMHLAIQLAVGGKEAGIVVDILRHRREGSRSYPSGFGGFPSELRRTDVGRFTAMTNWSLEGWPCRILLMLAAALVLSLVLMQLGRMHPLLEAITNVRAQLIPLALVPFVGFVVLQRWNLAAISLLLVVLLSLPMLGYWTASPDVRVEGSVAVTAMQYNVFFGNDDFEAIAVHISDSEADIVALHELLPEQWLGLEPLLGDYPYRIAEPLDEIDGQPGGGMALLSKTPLVRLEPPTGTSPEARVTLVVRTMLADREVVIVGLHPHASRTDGTKVALRETQVEGVAALAAESTMPVIVLTDLNATPTSPMYQDLLDQAGWRDPHHSVGWQSTWPTWGGPFGIAIDHVLVSNEFSIHAMHTGDGAGSDHKSLIAELSLPRT